MYNNIDQEREPCECLQPYPLIYPREVLCRKCGGRINERIAHQR